MRTYFNFVTLLTIFATYTLAISPAFPQPGILWQKEVEAKEFDYLEYIGNDLILVGTFDLNSSFWKPEYEDLMLMNVTNGEMLWKTSRTEYFNDDQVIMLAKNHILLKSMNRDDSKTLFASIDINTGKERWNHEIKNAASFMVLNVADNEIIIVSDQDEGLHLTGINLNDKTGSWESEVPEFDYSKKGILQLDIHDGHLYISGNEILKFSLGDHKAVWKQKLPEDTDDQFNFYFTSDYLFCYNDDYLIKLNSEKGDISWEKRINNIINVASIDNNLYLVRKISQNEGSALESFNNESGDIIWRYSFNENLQSPLTFDEGKIYLSSVTKLYCVDSKNGMEKYQKEIPDILCSDKLQVDILKILGDTLILARESGLVSIDKKNGAIFYAHYIDGYNAYSLGYIYRKLYLNIVGSAQKKADIRELESFELAEITKKVQFHQRQSSIVSFGKGFERHQQAVQLAQTNQMMANYAGVSQLSTVQVSMVGYAYGYAIGTAIATAVKGKSIACRARSNVMLADYLKKNFAESLFQDYFFRPYYKDGWYIAVIRIRDGYRTTIPVCEKHFFLSLNGPNILSYTYLPNKGQLVYKSYYSDSHPLTLYKQKGMYPDETGLFGKTGEMTYPFISVLNVASLEFSPDTSDEVFRMKRKINTDEEMELIQSMTRKNVKKARSMIENGVSVNFRDEFGLTPAMYAAVTDDKKLIKAVKNAGGDFTLVDDQEWAPWHYSFYCIVMPKSLRLTGKFYRQQVKNK